MLFGYNTSAAPDQEVMPDSIVGEVTEPGCFKFLYAGLRENLFWVCSDSISISYIKKGFKKRAANTEALEKGEKYKFKNYRILMVHSGHIDQHNLRIKRLEYLQYNVCWNFQRHSTLSQIFSKRSDLFAQPVE